MITTEKRFESDIESALLSQEVCDPRIHYCKEGGIISAESNCS